MPAKVKVRILAGRNLPVMDKSSDASDAFVEVKLANTTYKTEVYRRSLNPFWNSEWFRFEVSDQELQDEPLQVRIMDYDTYSANDAIGKVYINLNPLLVTPSKSMSGWLPIYDTLHGIRGEINCMVKLNIFADNNRFRQSSCGVRFFFSDIPNGYRCEAILGFVDELLVNDDPEYQWIDKIRTPRASNEARQTLFTKLSGEVQRKLGLKAEILGGNAVIGYQQSFDLEGGSGIVGRGIGTAVVLSRIGSTHEGLVSPIDNPNDIFLYHPDTYAINNNPYGRLQYSRRTSYTNHNRPNHSRQHSGSRADRHDSRSTNKSHLVHSLTADYFYEVPIIGDQQNEFSLTLDEPSSSNLPLLMPIRNQDGVIVSDHDDCQTEKPKTTTSQPSTIIGNETASLDGGDETLLTETDLGAAGVEIGSAPTASTNSSVETIKQSTSPPPPMSSITLKHRKMLAKSQSLAAPQDSTLIRSTKNTETQKGSKNYKQNQNSEHNVDHMKRSESMQNSSVSSSKIQPNPNAKTFTKSSNHVQRQQQSKHQSLAANLTKSFGVMKAQQHLLTNLIRHQNQNLIPTENQISNNKVRSVFIYPNMGEHQSEYPFVTFKKFPDNMIRCTGGVVSVHSVKLLDHIINDEESETRDIWWTEIRKEISCHAKSLNCNTIIGYRETSKVVSDVCILSAYGTAAIMSTTVDFDCGVDSMNTNINGHEQGLGNYPHQIKKSNHQQYQNQNDYHSTNLRLPNSDGSPPASHSFMPSPAQKQARSDTLNDSIDSSLISSSVDESNLDVTTTNVNNHTPKTSRFQSPAEEPTINDQTNHQNQSTPLDCSFCHTPLICSDSINLLPTCSICRQAKVPDVLLLTIEPPPNLNIVSKPFLVQARVCRAKRDSHGEIGAKEIGESLPFLEYELHRQLFSKLKFKGLNCLFNLTVDISVGENMISGLATGSGCFVLGLDQPEVPQISGGKGIKTSKLQQIQRLIESSSIKNRLLLNMDEINVQLEAYHSARRRQLLTARSNNIVGGHETANITASRREQLTGSRLSKQSGDLHSLRSLSSSPNPTISSPVPTQQSSGVTTTKQQASNLLSDDNNIILEVDDTEDANIIALLIDSEVPDGYTICNSETLPLIDQSSITNINMFTQIMRAKLTGLDQFGHLFDWILQALFVKLRRSLPCCLTNLTYAVDLPESNVVQVTISGCLLALQKPENPTTTTGSNLDEAQLVQSASQNSLGSLGESGSSGNARDLKKSPSGVEKPALANANSSKQAKTLTTTSTSASPRTSSSVSSSSESMESNTTTSASSNANQRTRLMRTVFKKQQTYPGALAPALGGQDPKMGPFSGEHVVRAEGGVGGSLSNNTNYMSKGKGAARRATLLLNKVVKQPLKDLSSNLNANTSGNAKLHHDNSIQENQLTASTSTGAKLLQRLSNSASSSGISGSVNVKNQHNSASGGTNTNPNKSPKSNIQQLINAVGINSNNGDQSESIGMKMLSSSNNIASGQRAQHYEDQQQKDDHNQQHHPSNKQYKTQNHTLIHQQQQQQNNHHHQHQHQNHHNRYQRHQNHHQHQYCNQHSSPSSTSSSTSNAIDITSLSYIPGAKEYHYLGNLSFSFVRETGSVRENGGLNGFIHCFLMEVFAIVRAHVSALGGNALLSLRLQQSCIWYHSNKNQAQCLISVAGDAVHVVH